jgi:hypothetical protein
MLDVEGRHIHEPANESWLFLRRGVGVQWELPWAATRRDRGRTWSRLAAIPPPRGRPGEGSMDSPFRVDYLDAERLLPVLVRKAA